MSRPRFAAKGRMTVFPDFPASREEAIAQGRSYFKNPKKCPDCGTSIRWVSTNSCMGCADFNGARYPRRGKANEFIPAPVPASLRFDNQTVNMRD